jgi:signal peptidase II
MTRTGRLAFYVLAASVLVLDQGIKAVMTAQLAPRGSVSVVPGLFSLTYVRNTGAVFGLFRSLPEPWRSLLLTLVPLAAVLFVIVMAMRTPPGRLRPLAALGLILGGALGNLVDRIRFGSVVDFLDVYIGEYHWPAFNLADSAICVGVGLLILDILRSPAADGNASPPADDPRPTLAGRVQGE